MSIPLRKAVTPFPDPAQHALQQLLVSLGDYRDQTALRAEFPRSVGATGGELWRK